MKEKLADLKVMYITDLRDASSPVSGKGRL